MEKVKQKLRKWLDIPNTPDFERFNRAMDKRADEFDSRVRKAIHGAYAGIVCVVCGKNVFRGEGTWVHGNGGKAYCLDPCWKERNETPD